MSSRLYRTSIAWLPLAVLFTILVGMVYFLAQQNLRQDANDPQIQIATDAANVLATGQRLAAPLFPASIDLAKSPSPFVIVIDEQGNILQSSGMLNGKTELPPDGVFTYAKLNQEDRFTWEPQSGVRIATVVKYFSGTASGYVIVGRSLAESEQRQNTLLLSVIVFWVGGLIICYLTKVFVLLFLDVD